MMTLLGTVVMIKRLQNIDADQITRHFRHGHCKLDAIFSTLTLNNKIWTRAESRKPVQRTGHTGHSLMTGFKNSERINE